ncbi:hypothetical protein ACWEAF_20185 [Streptomyces sp. NPDC005071]|uniref:hypothetical protein n=1 Tax=Streptomyces sp. 900116325 TaxID=3154295 RepID=UPI0033A590E0
MDISRTVRIVAAGGLAVLAGFFAAGQVHAQADIVARDTTWSAPVDTIPAPPADTIPAPPADTAPASDDTTWSAPVDGGLGDGPVLATPNDTTWGW